MCQINASEEMAAYMWHTPKKNSDPKPTPNTNMAVGTLTTSQNSQTSAEGGSKEYDDAANFVIRELGDD